MAPKSYWTFDTDSVNSMNWKHSEVLMANLTHLKIFQTNLSVWLQNWIHNENESLKKHENLQSFLIDEDAPTENSPISPNIFFGYFDIFGIPKWILER